MKVNNIIFKKWNHTLKFELNNLNLSLTLGPVQCNQKNFQIELRLTAEIEP